MEKLAKKCTHVTDLGKEVVTRNVSRMEESSRAPVRNRNSNWPKMENRVNQFIHVTKGKTVAANRSV